MAYWLKISQATPYFAAAPWQGDLRSVHAVVAASGPGSVLSGLQWSILIDLRPHPVTNMVLGYAAYAARNDKVSALGINTVMGTPKPHGSKWRKACPQFL
jgi:hypothetical protein